MWQIGKTYTFVPSGDASELKLRIVKSTPLREAIQWYETTYNRPLEQDATKAFKAIVVKGGYDADTHHTRGDVYYVFDSDFGPTYSQPEGPRLIPPKGEDTYGLKELAREEWGQMESKERKKALGGITTEYGVKSSWEALTQKDRNIVTNYLFFRPE